MIPVRRDFQFVLPAQRATTWHPAGRHVTQFLNTLSVFFPVGERFFIGAVRHYRAQVTDPQLHKAITAFIGQEAMHGREHEAYNQLLADAGLPIAEQEREIKVLLDRLAAWSPEFALNVTIALEHFTAILADQVLSNEGLMRGAEPSFESLWHWHALEETEHKAVVFDLWKTVMPKSLSSYAKRTGGLVFATTVFLAMVIRNYTQILKADPDADRHLQGVAKLLAFTLVNPAPLRNIIKPWLDYFKPGFHPWDHNNAQYLQELEVFAPQK